MVSTKTEVIMKLSRQVLLTASILCAFVHTATLSQTRVITHFHNATTYVDLAGGLYQHIASNKTIWSLWVDDTTVFIKVDNPTVESRQGGWKCDVYAVGVSDVADGSVELTSPVFQAMFHPRPRTFMGYTLVPYDKGPDGLLECLVVSGTRVLDTIEVRQDVADPRLDAEGYGRFVFDSTGLRERLARRGENAGWNRTRAVISDTVVVWERKHRGLVVFVNEVPVDTIKMPCTDVVINRFGARELVVDECVSNVVNGKVAVMFVVVDVDDRSDECAKCGFGFIGVVDLTSPCKQTFFATNLTIGSAIGLAP